MSNTHATLTGCLGILCSFLLSGCDAADDGGETPASSSTAGTTSDGAEDPTESSGQADDSPSDIDATCAEITDPQTCESMGGFDDETASGWLCNWETWVEVELVDGACSFGEVQSACTGESYSTAGCAAWGSCEQGGIHAAVTVAADGTVQLGTSPNGWCFGAYEDACGAGNPNAEDPAECACACDPGWPGA
ncbi:MAG: hypothetical protein ACE37F_33910 [Nannocystaceae bacterium]|nr:hypothetical protein [bacterium]